MTSGRLGQGTGQQFGSGWISGVLGVTCGALGYGGVLCLLFPSWLTTPSARALYPLEVVRFLIYVNFAVHLPWIDRLFGTAHLPAACWPDVYGIEGEPVPEGYWRQLVWPFRGATGPPQARTRSDFGS